MTGIKDLEKTIWSADDELCRNMKAAEFKHVVLVLIFLRYINETFDLKKVVLKNGLAGSLMIGPYAKM